MMLIFNLTSDYIRDRNDEDAVKSYKSSDNIRCEQILTEHGICYVSNNILASELSARFEHRRNFKKKYK